MEDSKRVGSKGTLLKSHASEQVKQHIVYDAQERVKFVFTAYINAVQGTPCECTEYVYRDISSSQVKDRQERVYNTGWQENWDNDFVFDPDGAYDPDGDGIL